MATPSTSSQSTLELDSVAIRRIQNEQIEILKEVDRICREFGISYQLYAGSLIGLVRHQGPIPWDDDIDIAMIREEYDRFIKICKSELRNDFFLQTPETEPQTPHTFAKIRRNGTVFRELRTAHIKMHHGLFIDIFPFDRVPESNSGRYIHEFLINLGHRARSIKLVNSTHSGLTGLVRVFLKKLLRLVPLNLLNSYFEFVTRFFNKTNSPMVSQLSSGVSTGGYSRCMVPRADFFDLIELPFDGVMVFAPRAYHDHLTRHFGNYLDLPAVNERVPGHNIIELKL